MQPGRQRVRLITRFACERDRGARRKRAAAELLHDNAHLALANKNSRQEQRNACDKISDDKSAAMSALDECPANMISIFIPISEVAGRCTRYRRAAHSAFYDWVNKEPAQAGSWRIALPNADEVS